MHIGAYVRHLTDMIYKLPEIHLLLEYWEALKTGSPTQEEALEATIKIHWLMVA